MDRAAFSHFRDEHYAKIAAINDAKGRDYAGDADALANFKAAAEQLGVDPNVIWAVYAHKHWSAIMSFVKNGQVESEPIEGRIHDCILYLFLLLGLIEDAKSGLCRGCGGDYSEPPTPGCPVPERHTEFWICNGIGSGQSHDAIPVAFPGSCPSCGYSPK